MAACRFIRSHWISFVPVFLTALAYAPAVSAQHNNRWGGVVADEARPSGTDLSGANLDSPRALSGDGRFVVFVSQAPLVPEDTAGEWDVYLRDRQTGALTRVTIGFDGSEANGVSSWPTISSDGRHIAFASCASNLVPGDENGLCDLFIYNRETSVTVRANVTTDGAESIIWDSSAISLSADGRHALFATVFPGASAFQLWLQDRDADANGVYDEPGTTTLTAIPRPSIADVQLFDYGWVVMSGDARYLAFTSDAYTLAFEYLGTRLFLHDRDTGVTMQVGDTTIDASPERIYTSQPDFSDAGHLVYMSNAPSLVLGDDDHDIDFDVFVLNLLSGEHRRLQLTHEGAPRLVEARGPAISGDGRYVTFVGVHDDFYRWSNVYVFDRELGISFDVSVKPDGQLLDRVGDYPSIDDSGDAIAFLGLPYMLVEGCCNDGIFVATSLSLLPDQITVSADGELVPIEVNAPENVAWSAWSIDQSVQQDLLQLIPSEGVGPGTIEIFLPANYTEDERAYWVVVGSEHVVVRQPSAPQVWWVDPNSGPHTGGTAVNIFGSGFVAGTTVTFGDQPALNVIVENNGYIRATTPQQLNTGYVDIVVTGPRGGASVVQYGFYYVDGTPPVITPRITGLQGKNGWYTSDVAVEWMVHDNESPVHYRDCQNLIVDFDTRDERVVCNAMSEGGQSSEELHVKRDTTQPLIGIVRPSGGVYKQGELVTASFTCSDKTSGVASCVGSVRNGAALDTSAIGSVTFDVLAEDHAGHQRRQVVKYVVKGMPVVTWPTPSDIVYGTALNPQQLNASANVAGTFSYSPAAGTVLPVGTHTLTVTFVPADTGSYFTTSTTTTIAVTAAPLTIIANHALTVFGQPLPAFTASAIEFVNGDTWASLNGALVFTTTATSESSPGTYALAVSGVSSPNYTIRFASGTLTVVKASTQIVLTSTPNPSRPQREVLLSAQIHVVAPGAGVPTGLIEFREDGEVIGTVTITNGIASLTHRFKRGTHTVSATYLGDANYSGAAATITQTVN